MKGGSTGDAIQAGGSIFSGLASMEAGKFNRKVSRINAINQEREGTAEEARIRDAARLAMGAQVAAQGESGFQTGTGSAVDALKESAINDAVMRLQARRQARSGANASRVAGNVAYAAGVNAFTGSVISAANALVPGGG